MRTTLVLDDELLANAQAVTDLQEKSALVREALRALIERESAQRLIRAWEAVSPILSPTHTGASEMILIDTLAIQKT